MLGYPDFQYVTVSNFTTTHFKGPSALSPLSLGQFKLPFSVTENLKHSYILQVPMFSQ